MRNTRLKSILFFAPYLTCFLLFWLTPFVYGLILSLHKYSLTRGNGGFVGLENYANLFNKSSLYGEMFQSRMMNTLLFVVISVIPLVVIGLLLALLVQSLPSRVRNVFRTIFFISYAVSVTAVSAIFRWLLAGNGGYVNTLLVSSGIVKTAVPFLETQPFAWVSILIATIWWTIGFNMIMFINALNEIDISLKEAAALDGAGAIGRFIYIVLPGIKNVLFFVLMNTVIASFNLFGQCQLMTKGGPGQSTRTIMYGIFDVVLEKSNLGMGSAMALLTGLIMMAISLLQYFLTNRQGAE